MTTTSPPTSRRRRKSAPSGSKSHPWPDFVGAWPRLVGRQDPEFESRHPGDESEGDRCAKFGARIGMRCMPWEWSTVRGILSLQPANDYGERLWTHRDVCIECTRQQGKTLIVVLLILFHLFIVPVFGRARPYKIVYTAQRWSTALDVFNRVVKVIDRVPSLKSRLALDGNGRRKRPSTRDNHGVIELKNGAVAEFAPRSQEFGRGLTELDILFIDEAYDVDPAQENDLTGAQSASQNPQTIYLSTPPVFLKHPKCHSLADMHRLGHARAADLFYRLFAAPRHMSRDDPATWAIAQPSYGVATNEREIRSKRQKAKNTVKRAIFDADYCGWGDYPPPEVEGDSEIPAEKWTGMKANPGMALVGPKALVLERSGSGALWVLIGVQRTSAGMTHIEVRCLAASAAKVLERVITTVESWDPVAVVVRNRSGAAELLPEIEAAGIEATVVNSTDAAQACGLFLSAALGGELSHSDQSELDDAVANAQKHPLPAGGFVWEELDDASFPCLMGASLGLWALIKFGQAEESPPSPEFENTGAAPADSDRWTSADADFDVMSAPL